MTAKQKPHWIICEELSGSNFKFMFKLWSENNQNAKEILRPDLGLRRWNELSDEEKYKVWKYLESYFFDKDIRKNYNDPDSDGEGRYYYFSGERSEKNQKQKRIYISILALNNKYKNRSYGKKFLEDQSLDSACLDFFTIFKNEDENVALELLSLYCRVLIKERGEEKIWKQEKEDDETYNERLVVWRWADFDKFAEDLNEVFVDFGINVHLTRLGFAPRQEKKIIKEIYEPVLSCLSDQKWKKVNEILSDAFSDYTKNTPQGYSGCVTKTISAVEAYLQILVDGKTGGKKLSSLISEGQKSNLIPDDIFTHTIFRNIEAIFARERKSTGDAHPKAEYATEKNARTILNLAMIFIQHCIQK